MRSDSFSAPSHTTVRAVFRIRRFQSTKRASPFEVVARLPFPPFRSAPTCPSVDSGCGLRLPFVLWRLVGSALPLSGTMASADSSPFAVAGWRYYIRLKTSRISTSARPHGVNPRPFPKRPPNLRCRLTLWALSLFADSPLRLRLLSGSCS